jgi:hypothetical protein
MRDAVRGLTGRLARARPTAGPVVFHCRHRVHGVGMFDLAEVQAGDELVAAAGADGGAVDVVVGTLSSCHGAVSLLRLGAAHAWVPPRPPAPAIFPSTPNQDRG